MFIEGFEIHERLYESANSLVHRAVRVPDNEPVVIKILKNDYPSPVQLTQFRQEFRNVSSIASSGVVRVYEQRRYGKTLFLVFEDFGGQSLREWMAGKALEVDRFLDVAVKIAGALGEVHASSLIHKDINPSNIVINPENGEVKIIDFGISTPCSAESPLLKNPRVLEGTLHYMSPEQTGRMNRAIDYRTDFYSLGATFYEMLTGERPFTGYADMELVHCHIARELEPVHHKQPQVSSALSKVVSKLMAKRAGDRYQGIEGLLADLEIVREGGQLERFVPGTSDYSDRFQVASKLYGRDLEISQLLGTFETARHGRAEMMLIGGYSGVGKTVLVQEVYKSLSQTEGYFISGKFDQLQRNVPFSALVAAFRDLVRQLLAESEGVLATWRRRLRRALEPNAQVMIDVLPDLELIIGRQPPAPELDAAEAANRFRRVVVNLLRASCSEDRPLVVFLDDLQWADSATLNFLEVVMTDDKMQHLLMIGAFRDNEVDAVHPLRLTVDKMRRLGARAREISLAPLHLEDVTRLIADTLHREIAHVGPLAELVIQKTGGNPFFVGQFLRVLHRDRLIYLERPERGGRPRWEWDIEAIRHASMTDNIVELLLDKLRELSAQTQDALRHAACLGNRFSLTTLAVICQASRAKLYARLHPAVHDELLRPLSEPCAVHSDDVLSPLVVEELGFQHDRVQQAAYALFEEQERIAVHLSIGRRLYETLDADIGAATRRFDVADHFNLGRSLIEEESESWRLARLNLEAGTRAWEATAYEAALEYLRIAFELLPENAWQADYALTIGVHRLLAEVEYLNGHFDRCQALVDVTLRNARTDLEQAEVYCTRIVQHTQLAQFDKAIEAGQKALALLSITLPVENLGEAAEAELGRVAELLDGREPRDLADLPDVETAEKALAQRCFKHLVIAAFLYNQELFPVITALSVQNSLEFGNAPESALSYANYGLVLGAVMQRYRDGHAFGELALDVCRRFHGKAPIAAVCLVLGSEVLPWVKPISEAIPIIERGYREGLDNGDILWSGYLVMYRVVLDTFQSVRIDQLLADLPEQVGFTERTQNLGATHGMLAHEIVLSTLAGHTASRDEFAARGLGEQEFLEICAENHSSMALCFFKILKAQAQYLLGEYRSALELTQEIEPLLGFIVNHPNLADHALYQALSLAALIDEQAPETREQSIVQIEARLAQLEVWADFCPENYAAKRSLVAAELARIRGDAAAAEHFDQAIDEAHQHGMICDEALATELAGRFEIARRPRSRVCAMYLRDAHYAYRLWGARRKVEALEQELGPYLSVGAGRGGTLGRSRNRGASGKRRLLLEEVSHLLARGPDGKGERDSVTVNRDAFDLATILKAARALSSEIVLGRLLEQMIEICIENAGARRGVLLVESEGELRVEAEAQVDGSVTTRQSIPLEAIESLPRRVIRFVERTREIVALDDASRDERFAEDSYIHAQGVKSVLCLPARESTGRLTVLYLENHLATGVFTQERITVLQLLTAQAAIAIENALLYETLEQKVEQRTLELQEMNDELATTLTQLRETQDRLIMQDRLASLGYLTAGIGHELKNPLNFIVNFAEVSNRLATELRDRVGHLGLPTDGIDGIFEDLRANLESINRHGLRADGIIRAMQMHSRSGGGEHRATDLNALLIDNVKLAHHGLRSKDSHFEVAVVTDLDAALGAVHLVPEDIGRVVLNLIQNACHAADARKREPGHPDVAPEVRVVSKESDDLVEVRIRDNGLGVEESIRDKIFDPFFTTKPGSEGTGLGLFLSYDIVVRGHNGELTFETEPGEYTEFIMRLPKRAVETKSEHDFPQRATA